MNIAFCTCVQLGLSCVEEILRHGHQISLLITLEDTQSQKKSGRVYLDDLSHGHRIPLIKTKHINDPKIIEALGKHNIDWLFIVGWSQIAGIDVIRATRKGVIGAHPTLLPRGRGRAAIPWAIIKGLDKTGVTFFKIDEDVDTGDILAQEEIPISNTETAFSLYQKVNSAHMRLAISCVEKINIGQLTGKKQDNRFASYWPGRTPKDGEITNKMTVDEIDRLVRATTRPYPGAFFREKTNSRTIIWSGSKSPSLEAKISIACLDGTYFGIDIEKRPDNSH